MDNIIQKFYSNGNRTNNYSKLGAFSTHMISNKKRLPFNPYQTIDNNKPITAKFNPSMSMINPPRNNTNYNFLPSKRYGKTIEEEFLHPKDLVFNCSSDLLYNINNMPRGEYYLEKENLIAENKKNVMKMQMIEEKMRNLELKNQRLEVINNFLFDTFENKLNQQELKKMGGGKKALMEEKKIFLDDESNDDDDDGYRRRRKKLYKSKSDVNINKYDDYYYLKNNFDAKKFQLKTAQDARDILDSIKKDIGNYMIEEEFKKNNQIQDITEGINELKSDLAYKLDKMQKNQKIEMQKMAYCLLHSGNHKIQGLATRLFNSYNNDSKDIDRLLNDEQTLYDNDNYYNLNDGFQRSRKYSNKSFISNNYRMTGNYPKNNQSENMRHSRNLFDE